MICYVMSFLCYNSVVFYVDIMDVAVTNLSNWSSIKSPVTCLLKGYGVPCRTNRIH